MPTPFEGKAVPAEGDSLPASAWRRQQPLILSSIEAEAPEGDVVRLMLEDGFHALTFIPLSHGDRRLGLIGFGFKDPHRPNDQELAFFQRVASEFALTVDAYLTKVALQHERDRIRVLFEVTTAVTSELPIEALYRDIAEQLRRVVRYDFSWILLRDKATQQFHLTAVDPPDQSFRIDEKTFSPEGLPSNEAITTGKPVVTCGLDFNRFPARTYRKYAPLYAGPSCCVPLLGRHGALGALRVSRYRGERFTNEEVELLVQVCRQLSIAIGNSLAYAKLAEMNARLAMEKLYLEQEIRFDQNLGGMVGESPAFQEVLRNIRIVAPTDATVLVQGETGTGKELIARAIHDLSKRSKQSFVRVNCAAIPETLLESELFGHEKGSFTGAFAQKLGRFELADKGTLFLDEIGEIPLELQPKLLRATQEQELERLGGNKTINVDVRIIAAIHRKLKRMVEEGNFRSDLYYRPHVFPLTVPPLRERKDDMLLLIRYFAQKYAQRMNRSIDEISSGEIEVLMKYDWPGNIRELQNIIERSVILSSGPTLHIVAPEQAEVAIHSQVGIADESDERDRLLRVLRQCHGQVGGPDGAAARLGMRRTTLQSKIKRLGIERAYR